jgi:hypothetical protein
MYKLFTGGDTLDQVSRLRCKRKIYSSVDKKKAYDTLEMMDIKIFIA